jgi:hypothetical protein
MGGNYLNHTGGHMLNSEEALRYGETLSKQKSLKSPGKCRKCKKDLNLLRGVNIIQEIYRYKWDTGRNDYQEDVEINVVQSDEIKMFCGHCGAKVPKRREKK